MTVIKVIKNQIFKNVDLPLKPTWRSCFLLFHLHDPKKSRTTKYKAVEQRPDQHKVRHVWSIGVISFVLREIYRCEHRWPKNTSQFFSSKKVNFSDIISNFFLQNLMWFAFNLMLDWRAMTVTVHLAPWSKGHSLSVQCYDFCLQAILFL